MGAFVLTQVPNSNISTSVAANELSLVGMDHNIIDRNAVSIIALHVSAPCVPNLDCTILGGRDEPLRFAMESYTGDIARVTVEGQDGIGVRRLDVI